MKDESKTKKQLIDELRQLRHRFSDTEGVEVEHKRTEEAFHRVNRAFETLIASRQVVIAATDESHLIRGVCRVVVEIGGYRLAWVGLAENDEKKTVRPVGQWGHDEGYLATVNITWADTARGRGPTGTAIRTGVPGVVRHIRTNPDYEPWRAEALKRGYASSIALPLLDGDSAFGTLNIYAAEDDVFDRLEVRLLTEVAECLSYGLRIVRLRSEHERTEEELSKSETKCSTVVESSLTGIYIEQGGKIVFANDRFCQIYGYSKDELRGMGALEFIHPKDRPLIDQISARRLKGEKAPAEYVVRGLTKDGKTIWVMRRNTLIDVGGGTAILGNVVDITRRKEMEKTLKKSQRDLRLLSSQLLTAQEDERKRIARELHDSIGQSLSAIKFGLENTLRGVEHRAFEACIESLKGLIPMIQTAIEEVRKIGMDLRPSTLDDLGILATIAWFCREFESIYSGIQIERRIEVKEEEVAYSLRTTIYRVLQEALNNVAKHSRANRVGLSLRRTGEGVELAIQDNGVGFDRREEFDAATLRRGLGIASMRERIELSGGSFTIESSPGQGTVVRAWWANERMSTNA
jgi:PAS domain S-box-containing protein